MKLKKKDFLTLQELPREQLDELIEYILKIKTQSLNTLNQKSVINLLLTPSLHTRILMEASVQQLGGRCVTVDHRYDKWKLLYEDDALVLGNDTEHAKDAAQILSGYGDCIAVQHVPYSKNWRIDRQDSIIKVFAQNSSVPIINLESALFNPCQALADIVTIKEHLKSLNGWKAVLAWTYHPTLNNMSTANSFALAASKSGMDLTVVSPEGYELDHGILKLVGKNARNSGGSFEISNNLEKAALGAHIVYAVNWRSIKHYSDPDTEFLYGEKLANWKIEQKVMEKTDGGYLMHPSPIKRNVSVMSEILDGKTSLVYKQSENRLHTQRALLSAILNT